MAEAAASVNSWFMPSPEVKRKQQSSGNGWREGGEMDGGVQDEGMQEWGVED